MTTKEIEQALYAYWNWRINIMVPRITGVYKAGIMFETDMMAISKSGYVTGFEIKISKQDFLKDFKKKQHKNFDYYFKPFKQFYYVMPIDLYEKVKDMVPEKFGIITAGTNNLGLTVLNMQRIAPILFNNKLTTDQIIKIAHLGCVRLINL